MVPFGLIKLDREAQTRTHIAVTDVIVLDLMGFNFGVTCQLCLVDVETYTFQLVDGTWLHCSALVWTVEEMLLFC